MEKLEGTYVASYELFVVESSYLVYLTPAGKTITILPGIGNYPVSLFNDLILMNEPLET